MMLKLEIKLLADCPEYIPQLAQLWFNEIGKQWIPNASVERAMETYKTHLNHESMPLTFVAIVDNNPVAMTSLRENDGIREDLTPWLGSLIVHPYFRRQRVGERLIDLTKERARAMGYEKLFLLALDPSIPNWYTRLGWLYIDTDKLYHHPVTVMEINV